MKNTSVRARAVFGICALAITFILIIARVLCNLFTLDNFTGYYTGLGAFASLYLPLIFVAVAAVMCFVPRFGITQEPMQNTRAVKMAALIPAAGFALYAFKCVEFYMFYHVLSTLQLLSFVASVFALVFFAFLAFGKKLDTPLYLICGIAVIFWAICVIALSYFDLYLPMNAPVKLINELACLALMLLVLSEIRATFDTKRRQLQMFSVTTALIVLGVASVPNVISYLFDELPYAYDLIFMDIVLLCAFVFAVVRFIGLCFSNAAQKSDEQAKSE